MISRKYLIIFGAIICLLFVYFIINEIYRLKKTFLPAYQKTMEIEAKFAKLEKDHLQPIMARLPNQIDSPALSITYHSEMVKNSNLSAKYQELSNTEAKKVSQKVDASKPRLDQKEICYKNDAHHIVPKINTPGMAVSNQNTVPDPFSDGSPRNVRKESGQLSEYGRILRNLTSDIPQDDPFGLSENELDESVIKSISESIQYANMPSENDLSDIPKKAKTKKDKIPKNK